MTVKLGTAFGSHTSKAGAWPKTNLWLDCGNSPSSQSSAAWLMTCVSLFPGGRYSSMPTNRQFLCLNEQVNISSPGGPLGTSEPIPGMPLIQSVHTPTEALTS